MGFVKLWGASAVALLAATASAHSSETNLPIVDLGYELHKASNFNETGRFYNFSNIRYAAPPVRFAAPTAPKVSRAMINSGSIGRICPQASPAWEAEAEVFLTDIILGEPNNLTNPYVPPGAKWSLPLPAQDPRASEDCLFLDVYVPENLLHATKNGGCGAPVLVWIYGGGYTGGNKFTNPAGLLAASGNETAGEVIYVSLNYRLGALGWTAGPTFQAEGGVSNLGLLDQRFALEWVQKYIHLFGGDKNKVTVFGESAGGGSVVHQITAYGGSKGKVPFQQAISQSPGWQLISSSVQQEDAYQLLLSVTNSTSLADLRKVSSADIIKANSLIVTYNSSYASFTYSPVVDGSFAPQQPGQLLARGAFDKSVKVMTGHNTNEGTPFTPPYINDTASTIAQLRSLFPYAPQKSIDHVVTVLYPPVFDGTYPYTTQNERAQLITTEAIFTCNTRYLATAYGNKTYSYLFAVPPAFHGLDVAYTYFTGGATSVDPTGVTNRTVAVALQDYITSFAMTGVPTAKGLAKFNVYGEEARVLALDDTRIGEVTDSNKNARCAWWQKGLIA